MSDKNQLGISWLKAIHRARFVYVIELLPALVYSRKHISISALLYLSGRKYDSISISRQSCFRVVLFFIALSSALLHVDAGLCRQSKRTYTLVMCDLVILGTHVLLEKNGHWKVDIQFLDNAAQHLDIFTLVDRGKVSSTFIALWKIDKACNERFLFFKTNYSPWPYYYTKFFFCWSHKISYYSQYAY